MTYKLVNLLKSTNLKMKKQQLIYSIKTFVLRIGYNNFSYPKIMVIIFHLKAYYGIFESFMKLFSPFSI